MSKHIGCWCRDISSGKYARIVKRDNSILTLEYCGEQWKVKSNEIIRIESSDYTANKI